MYPCIKYGKWQQKALTSVLSDVEIVFLNIGGWKHTQDSSTVKIKIT
jgi:hypothetical protein